MKKILVLAIILVFTASFADATLPVRERCSVNLKALMPAAKATLSEDGYAKLEQIFSNAKTLDNETATVGSVIFFEPALLPDLKRGDLKKVRQFLKTISDKRLVTIDVIGGGPRYKGGGLFRIAYSLEERTGADAGKKYYIKTQRRKWGETRLTGGSEYEIKLDK
jgi:hypothetical protein